MLRQRVSGHFFNIYTGYKVTEKKNIDEYAKMDANDESLKRWKESLGISEGATAAGEGPQVCTGIPIRILKSQLTFHTS